MELTRNQKFIAVLRREDGTLVKEITRSEALDLVIEAANTAKRKLGEYVVVYAEVGVSR